METEQYEDMDWNMCRVCGQRFPDEDDGVIHVNNEHDIRQQLNTLVENVNGAYSISMRKTLFESEYSARTYVMREVSQVERLSALLRPCFRPMGSLMDGSVYRGP